MRSCIVGNFQSSAAVLPASRTLALSSVCIPYQALCIHHISSHHVEVAAIAPNTMSSHGEGQKQGTKGERNPHTFLSLLFFRESTLSSNLPNNFPKAAELITAEQGFKCGQSDSRLSARNKMQATYAILVF